MWPAAASSYQFGLLASPLTQASAVFVSVPLRPVRGVMSIAANAIDTSLAPLGARCETVWALTCPVLHSNRAPNVRNSLIARKFMEEPYKHAFQIH
jgi:hypothetical protein